MTASCATKLSVGLVVTLRIFAIYVIHLVGFDLGLYPKKIFFVRRWFIFFIFSPTLNTTKTLVEEVFLGFATTYDS